MEMYVQQNTYVASLMSQSLLRSLTKPCISELNTSEALQNIYNKAKPRVQSSNTSFPVLKGSDKDVTILRPIHYFHYIATLATWTIA